MKAALALAVLLAVPAALQAGSFEDAGFLAGQLLRFPASFPQPTSIPGSPAGGARRRPLPPLRSRDPESRSVALAPLLDRHFKAVDSFGAGAGKVYLSAQLDLKGEGYLAVASESSAAPTLFKLERGMSGQWSVDGRRYSANLSVSVFRKRLNNYIVVKDQSSGELRYSRRIVELLESTYAAGESLVIAGKSYRLFYSHVVDEAARKLDPSKTGLCFIYDDVSEGGEHDYKFYMIPAADLSGAAPSA